MCFERTSTASSHIYAQSPAIRATFLVRVILPLRCARLGAVVRVFYAAGAGMWLRAVRFLCPAGRRSGCWLLVRNSALSLCSDSAIKVSSFRPQRIDVDVDVDCDDDEHTRSQHPRALYRAHVLRDFNGLLSGLYECASCPQGRAAAPPRRLRASSTHVASHTQQQRGFNAHRSCQLCTRVTSGRIYLWRLFYIYSWLLQFLTVGDCVR